MKFSKPCEFCNTEFKVAYKCHLLRRRFCSRSCRSSALMVTTGPRMWAAHAANHQKVELTCNFCKKKFTAPKFRKGVAKFCTKHCSDQSFRRENPNRHRGTSINGERKRDHTRIAEKLLERKIKPHEQIHHINNKKRDNTLENMILLTRGQHTTIHNWQRHRKIHMSAQDILVAFPKAIWLGKYTKGKR